MAARWRPSLAVALALAACGSSSKGDGKGPLGKATGEALAAAIAAAAETVEPWRCARLDEPMAVTAPAGWTLDGRTLRKTGGVARSVAVITDARGGSPAVTAALRQALDAQAPDVVVSLGGIGSDDVQIATTLGPLAQDAPWLIVAVPGDRESIGAHRAAVAAIARAGGQIVDGSQVRLIELEVAVIGTLPGVPFRERLGAGAAGCVHDAADVAAALTALTEAAGDTRATILATQRAPRGRDDRAPGGVHAGDLDLAAALREHPVEVVAHGSVDDAVDAAGKRKRGAGPPAAVAVGALDATPRYRDDGTPVTPGAVVITVGDREVSWRPLALRVVR